MDIIISGYGRMGKEVEKVCRKLKHRIIAIVDNESDWQKLPIINASTTVVIDFSMPNVAINNYLRCFNLGIAVVTGTTGWYEKFDKVSEQCNIHNGTLFYATNFSIGVNLFFKANTYLAQLMSGFNNYDIHINETHHIHKVDAPSGTAITTAEGIIAENKKLDSWELNKNDSDNSLPIFSIREGEITGRHEVVYESDEDKIILKHEAKNRSGFALGAVLAAEFVVGKKGVYNMDNLLNQVL